MPHDARRREFDRRPRKKRANPICAGKRRFVDETSAIAVGMVTLQEQCGNGKQLWIYSCGHCDGWHLTSKNNGRRYLVPNPQATDAVAA
jgi:hypothetical protein